MIRTMDVGMAVGATTVEILDGAERLCLRGVPAGVVAGIAYARHAYLQKLGVVTAVRLVTISAVLHDRRVLP